MTKRKEQDNNLQKNNDNNLKTEADNPFSDLLDTAIKAQQEDKFQKTLLKYESPKIEHVIDDYVFVRIEWLKALIYKVVKYEQPQANETINRQLAQDIYRQVLINSEHIRNWK